MANGKEKQAMKPVSGMVIARETFLTPGDIEQMRWVPELVFINCCHLGRTQSSGASDRSELAANLGVQFIRMGVRAVVAAGWAVDDGAANAFAEAFYTRLLDGQTFGEAVRAAREEIWLRFRGVNTWGAYQCYGDPSYRLHHNGELRIRRPPPYSTPTELIVDLDNLAEELKASSAASKDETAGKRINDLLERIPEPQRESWKQRADVASALGFAWGEARFWPEAIEWLAKALNAPKATARSESSNSWPTSMSGMRWRNGWLYKGKATAKATIRTGYATTRWMRSLIWKRYACTHLLRSVLICSVVPTSGWH
ncbi:CHAT domain-containing protein [Azotobacter chroococcum]